MKYFWIPMGLLCAILGLSLWCAAFVGDRTAGWRARVEQAALAAEGENWESAVEILQGVEEDWNHNRDCFHIITAHDELEAVDTLLSQAEGFAREREMAEFRAETAALGVQLAVIADLQRLSLRNIL